MFHEAIRAIAHKVNNQNASTLGWVGFRSAIYSPLTPLSLSVSILYDTSILLRIDVVIDLNYNFNLQTFSILFARRLFTHILPASRPIFFGTPQLSLSTLTSQRYLLTASTATLHLSTTSMPAVAKATPKGEATSTRPKSKRGQATKADSSDEGVQPESKRAKLEDKDEADKKPVRKARAKTAPTKAEAAQDENTEDADVKPKAKARARPKNVKEGSDGNENADDAVADDKPAKKPRASKSNPKVDPFHPDTLAKHPPRIGTTTSVSMTHIIGAHTSTSGGPEFALVNASELGANALAMFLKNQRRWESKGFEEASLETWKRMMKKREEGGKCRHV